MRAIRARDAGLALVSRINRWLITGAVALTAVFSAFAAHAFRGHTATAASSQTATQPASSSDDGGGGSLQQPAQAPTPAPAAPAPVVSGGS